MKQMALFMVSLFFVVGMPLLGTAQVSININVPPPPPLAFAAPPDVVVVPSGTSDVYLVPDTVGLYFYGGYWYRFHGDHWFRASVYSGPWAYIQTSLIPPPVVVIPPDYILALPPGYHRIHYGDFHSHWRDWGRNRYWRTQSWYVAHSQHHWAGREWRHYEKGPRGKPGSAGLHEKGPAGGKPGGVGLHEKGPAGGKPGSAGLHEKGPAGGKPGGVGLHEKGPAGGKPGGAGPKAGHPAKHE